VRENDHTANHRANTGVSYPLTIVATAGVGKIIAHNPAETATVPDYAMVTRRLSENGVRSERTQGRASNSGN